MQVSKKQKTNKDTNFIFETKDYMYLVSHVNIFIIGIICYYIFYENPFGLERPAGISNPIAIVALWSALGKGFYGIISFYQNKYKIVFYKNKINNKTKKFEINTVDVKEVYKLSFLLVLDDYWTLRRQHLLGRIVIVTILSPFLCVYFILNAIFKRLYFKKNIIHTILVIIGKNDKQMMKIQIPLENEEEQKQLEEYCKKYLNTDITKLKTRFFIPNNETWFIRNEND